MKNSKEKEKYLLIQNQLDQIEKVLSEAKCDFSTDSSQFFAKNIFKMGRFIRLYSDFMKLLEVLVADDVSDELENYTNSRLSIQHTSLLAEWDQFLSEIESTSNTSLRHIRLADLLHDDEPGLEYYQTRGNFVKVNDDSLESRLSLVDIHERFIQSATTSNQQATNQSFMLLVMLRHFAWLYKLNDYVQNNPRE